MIDASRAHRLVALPVAPATTPTILFRLNRYTPMPLGRRREPFDHPDWIYELKYDGFRALLSIGVEHPEFISRNANAFTRFSSLALFIDRELACPRGARWRGHLLRRGG
jgi:ATP-dependent DNA ligase